MNRAKINITLIYKITEKFASTLRGKKLAVKGRPKIYGDSVFLTSLLVRELISCSYRETILAVKKAVRIKKMPALFTIRYRISTMSKRIFAKIGAMGVDWL